MNNTSNNTSKGKVALGKGMSALLGNNSAHLMANNIDNTALDKKPEGGYLMVDITQVKANKEQPRKLFKDKKKIL